MCCSRRNHSIFMVFYPLFYSTAVERAKDTPSGGTRAEARAPGRGPARRLASTRRIVGMSLTALSMAAGCTFVASRWSALRGADSEATAALGHSARAHVSFLGSCDASGAVPITDHTFVVADDEDNVLRIYDADRGGLPLHTIDISHKVGIVGGTDKKGRPTKPPEADLEAATGSGSLAYWISSHARKKSGKLQPERFRFFATTPPTPGRPTELVGRARDDLLGHLLVDPRMDGFELEHAMTQAAGSPRGLNIEGMTAREAGGLFIGLRSPTYDERALVLTLENPEGVVRGSPPQFGPPQTLNLGGLGIRALSSWRSRYLIVAGGSAGGHESKLYTWAGGDSEPTLVPLRFPDFNPEAFFTPETRDRILLLSDDGERLHGKKRCKDLGDPKKKSFRGFWYRLPPSVGPFEPFAG